MTVELANLIQSAGDRDDVYALLERLARDRVSSDPLLSDDADLIFGDWPNWDDHIPWLLSATTERIADWVETIRPVAA